MVDVVVQVVDVEVETVGMAEVGKQAVLDRMILWRAIAVGCVAIWPATVPKTHNHREVAVLALPAENPLNPCNEARVVEEEGDDCGNIAAYTWGCHGNWLGMGQHWYQ